MSNRFSATPDLALILDASRQRRLWLLIPLGLLPLSLLLLARYQHLILLSLPGWAWLVYRLWPDPAQGVSLFCYGGQWLLSGEVIELASGQVRTPWVLVLPWRSPGGGRGGCLVIYADSAPTEALRRLRVLTGLQR